MKLFYPSELKNYLLYPRTYFPQLFEDFIDDYFQRKNKIFYKHNLIFIAGLPKSGTTWLEKLITEIPGYVQLNKSSLRVFKGHETLDHSHGINNKMIDGVPKNKFSFLKRHTHYKKEYIDVLNQNKVKPIILIRDIRDMMISRYYHILANENHWLNNKIKKLNFEDGLIVSMNSYSIEDDESVLSYYKRWINDWLDYIDANPKKSILVKFEDMKKDLFSEFLRVLNFFDFKFSSDEINEMLLKQKNKHVNKSSLKKNLNLPGRKMSTFRKGMAGEWKEKLTQKHKRFFLEQANDILIKSGYESDQNWF